jgi:hypothetical protein
MTTPDTGSAVLASGAGEFALEAAGQPLRPAEPQIPKNAKSKNIQVSPAVLDAARKSSEELLQDLRTADTSSRRLGNYSNDPMGAGLHRVV